MHDPEASVRRAAAEALYRIGLEGPQAVEPLKLALIDEDSHVRLHAALALGETGDTHAAAPLIDALSNTREEEHVRVAIVCAIVELTSSPKVWSPSLLNPLIVALHDPAARVRIWAARGLGQDPRPTGVERARGVRHGCPSRCALGCH